MLRRTGFSRPAYTPPPVSPLRRLARPVVRIRISDVVVACPKENALQHAGYMDAVRGLPCARCGHPPRSQFCHADEGKGLGIKTDCRRGWPGCAACHFLVGSTGILGQSGRRVFELEAGARTRAQVIALGLWPARLPMWEGESA
jgi:hypothetical protein